MLGLSIGLAGPAAAENERAPSAAARVVAAPTSAQPTIELVDLLRAAQRDLPAVLSALATLERVEAEQRVAEAAYLPKATGEATAGLLYDNRRVLPNESKDDDTTIDTESAESAGRIRSTSWTANAGVNLDWAALDLARKHNVSAARIAAQAQSLGVQAAQRVALMAAAELYVRALAASNLVEDGALNVARRTRQLDGITELADAGIRPRVDALRADIEKVAAEYVLEMRRVDEQAAFAALAAAVGKDPQIGVRPAPLHDDAFAAPQTMEEATRTAQETRPELHQLRAQIASQEASYRAAWGSRLPTLGLFASGQATYFDVLRGAGIQGDQYNANGGIYLRWNGGDAQIMRRRAVEAARIGENKRELQRAELTVRAETVDAAYKVQRAHAQLEQATRMLEGSRVTRVAQEERYQAGAASLLELLDAEALEQSARRARIEAERDLDLARAMLLAVCGTLSNLLNGG